MGVCERALWGLACLAALSMGPVGQAAGQVIEDITFPTVSFFDPNIYARPDGAYLATVLPHFIHRPIDDLTPRAGAEALAMGGAYLAVVEGPLAMAWNPAGLAGMRGAAIVADGTTISSSGSGSSVSLPDTLLIPGYGDFGISNYTVRRGSSNAFGFLGGALPLFDVGGAPLVGGMAYRRHSDIAYGEEILLEMRLFAATAGFHFTFGSETDERGFLESLTFALGYEAIRNPAFKLSLGSSANVLSGRLRADKMERVAVRNFDEGRGKYQQDYRGFSLEGGAVAEFGGLGRLAAWVGLPHTIRVENGRLLDLPIGSPDQTVLYRSHWTIADYDLEVPLFLSFGAAAGPFYGVEISADLNLRPWSEAEIKHRDPAFQAFDGPYPAADVESFHIGTRFEVPLLREKLHRLGLRLSGMAGYRTMPLSLYEPDLRDTTTVAPHYRGDQIEGSATTLGLGLEAGQVSFNLGLEFQSFDYQAWFLNDQSELGTEEEPGRGLWFGDPLDRVIEVNRSNTLLRFTTEFRP